MKSTNFDTIYKNVPHEQRERLKKFRSTHPYEKCITDGVTWEYISCGKGDEPLVLLPGGIRFADTWFKLITALEDEYKIVSPTYPAVSTMAEMTKGVFTILEKERIDKAHIIGTSFGGWVAQCFVRSYPDAVKTLILSNTSGPDGVSRTMVRFAQAVTFMYPEWLIRAAFPRNYFTIFSVPDSEREFWKAYLKEISFRTNKDDITTQQECSLDFIKNYHFSKDDLPDWSGRILILESDDDSAIKESAREALKALYPHAYIHTFHNAGHTPGYADPKEYISVVKTFLKEL